MIHHLFFNFHQMKLSDIAIENYITEGTKNWYTKDQLTTKETTRKRAKLSQKKNAWNNNTNYSVTLIKRIFIVIYLY